MRPGSGLGDFKYTPAPDLLSYRLTGRARDKTIVLRRGVPYTRKMQNDHRTREQVDFIRQLVQRWAWAHGGRYPPAGEVSAGGSVGQQTGYRFWPHNVWTHKPIAISEHWGDFSYRVDDDRDSFSLVAHFSRGGSVTLSGSAASSPWRAGLLRLQDEIATRNGETLEGYVREWALLHAGALPAVDDLSAAGRVGESRGAWPVDPFSDGPMTHGAGPGQFAYTPGPAPRYALTVYLSAGSVTLTGSVPDAP